MLGHLILGAIFLTLAGLSLLFFGPEMGEMGYGHAFKMAAPFLGAGFFSVLVAIGITQSWKWFPSAALFLEAVLVVFAGRRLWWSDRNLLDECVAVYFLVGLAVAIFLFKKKRL